MAANSDPSRCPFTAAMKYTALFVLGGLSVHLADKAVCSWKRQRSRKCSEGKGTSEKFNEHLKLGNFGISKYYDDYMKKSSDKTFIKDTIPQAIEALSWLEVYLKLPVEEKLKNMQRLSEEDKTKSMQLVAIYKPSVKSHGHHGVAHGGFTFALINHLITFLGFALNDFLPVVVKSLLINYRKPIKVEEIHMITVDVVRRNGSSFYLAGFVMSKEMEQLNDFDAEISTNGYWST